MAESLRSQQRRPGVAIARAAVRGVLFYSQLLLALMALEERLAYPRGGRYQPPLDFRFEEVWLATEDGCRLHAWYCPATRSGEALGFRPVALLFHGNGGELSLRSDEIAAWQRALGADVMIFDYRGYGKSSGQPTELGLYRDSRAAYRWLVATKRVDPSRILFIGESLGCAVAVELAQHVEHHALVLHSPFTSLPDAAANVYPWLPVRAIMRNRFPTKQRIAHCPRPIFLSHGARDRLIPVEHARTLAALVPERSELFLLAGRDHNDLRGAEYYRAVVRFLKQVEVYDARPTAAQ